MPKLISLPGGQDPLTPRWVMRLPPETDLVFLSLLQTQAGGQIEIRRCTFSKAPILVAPPGAVEGFFARLFISMKLEVPQEAPVSPYGTELVTTYT